MGESPFCTTAHIETFEEAELTYGVMVACSDGEVVFNFIDNAVVGVSGQRRTQYIRGQPLVNIVLKTETCLQTPTSKETPQCNVYAKS